MEMDNKQTERIIDNLDWGDGTVESIKEKVELSQRNYRRWVRYYKRGLLAGSILVWLVAMMVAYKATPDPEYSYIAAGQGTTRQEVYQSVQTLFERQ